MKIGDRVEKMSTKAHYKVVDFDNRDGEITLQRVISGQEIDTILKVKDLGGFKTIREKENEIAYFDGPYAFLSNFYEFSIEYDGLTYKTNEHAFQAAKTLDIKEKEKIRNESTAARAKFAGRHVVLRQDWETEKVNIMYEICKKKFENKELKNKLLSTENKILIEGNTWNDDFWGKATENGKNNLGLILMKIREEIKKEEV